MKKAFLFLFLAAIMCLFASKATAQKPAEDGDDDKWLRYYGGYAPGRYYTPHSHTTYRSSPTYGWYPSSYYGRGTYGAYWYYSGYYPETYLPDSPTAASAPSTGILAMIQRPRGPYYPTYSYYSPPSLGTGYGRVGIRPTGSDSLAKGELTVAPDKIELKIETATEKASIKVEAKPATAYTPPPTYTPKVISAAASTLPTDFKDISISGSHADGFTHDGASWTRVSGAQLLPYSNGSYGTTLYGQFFDGGTKFKYNDTVFQKR